MKVKPRLRDDARLDGYLWWHSWLRGLSNPVLTPAAGNRFVTLLAELVPNASYVEDGAP